MAQNKIQRLELFDCNLGLVGCSPPCSVHLSKS